MMMPEFKKIPACLFLSLVFISQLVLADTVTEQEVGALIESIKTSGCEFQRNGKTYNSVDAADHLAMKFSRGSRYAKTAEDFIKNLASKSSMSGKPYLINCAGKNSEPSGEWLSRQLSAMRNQQS